jgi:cysteine desulfurase
MLPFFTEHFGNASSNTHALGWYAQGAIEKARQQVANFIGAENSEIVFTSGATEAINMALKGVFEAYQTKATILLHVKPNIKLF